MGCDQGRRPRLALSYDDVRNLTKLQLHWSATPFDKEFGETCKGTVTVDVQAK
jgi:hypothetical protein